MNDQTPGGETIKNWAMWKVIRARIDVIKHEAPEGMEVDFVYVASVCLFLSNPVEGGEDIKNDPRVAWLLTKAPETCPMCAIYSAFMAVECFTHMVDDQVNVMSHHGDHLDTLSVVMALQHAKNEEGAEEATVEPYYPTTSTTLH